MLKKYKIIALMTCLIRDRECYELVNVLNAFHSFFYTVCRISVNFCRNLRYDVKNYKINFI